MHMDRAVTASLTAVSAYTCHEITRIWSSSLGLALPDFPFTNPSYVLGPLILLLL